MAGERLAKITLRVESIWYPQTLDLKLDGVWETFATTENQAGQPGPGAPYFLIAASATLAERYTDLAGNLENMLLAVRQRITARNLPYTVSAKRDVTAQVLSATPVWEFDIEAQVYELRYNLDFRGGTALLGVLRPWTVVANLTTIRPVLVSYVVTDATVFGSATGSIVVTATNGNNGVYTYVWADPGALRTATRLNLVNATYTVTVADSSGASTQVSIIVGSDPRLEVLINCTDNNVTLVASGGRSPYAFLWSDGVTTATRLNLPVGTFTCTVTDARGESRQVSLTVDAYRFYWSKNPVTLALDAGAAYRLDPATKTNLSFVCEVWVEEVYRSNTFVRLGPAQEQPADRFGRTVFDAQALLDGYLTEHLPALNQAQPSRADCLFRRFYFRYAEKFGAVPVAAALSNQAQHYVVLGGLDDYAVAAGTWFASYQAGAKPFLTWEPDNKSVLPSQPEYLYFMADSFSLASFLVQVQLRYANNTTAALTLATVTGVNRFEVFCLPVGYAQLGLAAGGPAVVEWEVWVSDAAGVAQTERRRYVLNPDYVAKPRYFLYANSLGGVSTFACVGDAKTALDVKAEEADRPAGGDPLLGDTLTTDRSGVLTLAVSSGNLKKAQLVAVQDFLLSTRVVLHTDAAYFPGRVKAKSVPLADEAPGEQKALDFDFLLPRQRQFTPRLPATLAGRAVVPVRGGEGAQP